MSIRGAVQGVGFRPFVHRLASELGLRGWVSNSPQGVTLELEGPLKQLEQFHLRFQPEAPPRSSIHGTEATWLDPVGYPNLEIRASDSSETSTAWVSPDITTCGECRQEIFDPSNRRFQYPFTNCTNCGPRFTIIDSMPYDRAATTMRDFVMCPACAAEYHNPSDRRYHAQPNACALCGPKIALWDAHGRVLQERSTAEVLKATAILLQQGRIVAVKGLGGFHLCVLARDQAAVQKLRHAKHREAKPFAIMSPSLEVTREFCGVSPAEERLLCSPEAPIVILPSLPAQTHIAPGVAPGNPNIGVMLPCTPLHHLLLHFIGEPIVATSGNLADEPICTDERDALGRLAGIAEFFLVHNRRIVRHVDDSITRVILGRELVLRRARGYSPFPVSISAPEDFCALAVGAHLKNTVAIAKGEQVFISQHIGDLETSHARESFSNVIADMQILLEAQPTIVAADAHPDYASTHAAHEMTSAGKELIPVQHHLAHVLGCMAENQVPAPVIGASWDGTGYGLDHTIWGGEFLRVWTHGWERLAHLRQFRLPGGEVAVRDPRRSALGLLHELGSPLPNLNPADWFSPNDLKVLEGMLQKSVNSPRTSSMGRLFDAVAALTGLCRQTRFEGEAAMTLEFALPQNAPSCGVYSFPLLCDERPWRLDWEPMLRGINADVAASVPVGIISARFHNGLAQAIVTVARQAGESRLVLSGGCFQNRYLLETTVLLAKESGLTVYWPQRVPPNDGGISLGQIVAAARQKA